MTDTQGCNGDRQYGHQVPQAVDALEPLAHQHSAAPEIKLAIIGDVHDRWDDEDEQALQALGVDLVLLVNRAAPIIWEKTRENYPRSRWKLKTRRVQATALLRGYCINSAKKGYAPLPTLIRRRRLFTTPVQSAL